MEQMNDSWEHAKQCCDVWVVRCVFSLKLFVRPSRLLWIIKLENPKMQLNRVLACLYLFCCCMTSSLGGLNWNISCVNSEEVWIDCWRIEPYCECALGGTKRFCWQCNPIQPSPTLAQWTWWAWGIWNVRANFRCERHERRNCRNPGACEYCWGFFCQWLCVRYRFVEYIRSPSASNSEICLLFQIALMYCLFCSARVVDLQ